MPGADLTEHKAAAQEAEEAGKRVVAPWIVVTLCVVFVFAVGFAIRALV